MLIAKRDLEIWEAMAGGLPQASLILARGGFNDLMVDFFVERALGKNKNGLIELTPEPGKTGIGIEQIRLLGGRLSLGSRSKEEVRLVVIKEAELLGREAQNAMLKILEEPVAGVYFLIFGSSLDAVLPTVRSRCQILSLGQPSETEVVGFAKQNFGLDEPSANLIWLQAGRRISQFMDICRDEELRAKSQELLARAKEFLGADRFNKFKVLKAFSDRALARDFIEALILILGLVTEQNIKLGKFDQALELKYKLSQSEEALARIKSGGNVKITLAGLV
jgi:DNA polymerase III delta prime subunit